MPRLNNSNHLDIMEEISDSFSDVTVVDVYDIASDIGKECEKIIDLYGANAVTGLMPKVINALELLENLATRNERENTQLLDLQTKICQLENEKLEKAEYRDKFEKELEAIEDQWRSETKDLVSAVSRLQEENRKLIREQQNTSTTSNLNYQNDSFISDISEHEAILQRLKDTIEKQRDEIRSKEKSIQEKNGDIDNLKTHVDCLSTSSKDAKRKHRILQVQVRTLCDERADFLVQLQDQQRNISALRQRLGLAEKENEDLIKLEPVLPSNKAVYDLDDLNRPRFTTQELKDILNERNELKARLSDLEDELETYRPKRSKEKLSPTELEDDAPVQGPLPLEPDDAPWKKSESGIRKLDTSGNSGTETCSVFGNYSLKETTVGIFQNVACRISQKCLSQLITNRFNYHKTNYMFHIDMAGNVAFI